MINKKKSFFVAKGSKNTNKTIVCIQTTFKTYIIKNLTIYSSKQSNKLNQGCHFLSQNTDKPETFISNLKLP